MNNLINKIADDKNNNNNKKKNNKNNKKKRSRLLPKVSLYDKRSGEPNNVSFYPNALRNMGFERAYKMSNKFMELAQIEYLYGLLYPDRAYKNGRVIKLPNPLPIPTNTFSWCFTKTYTCNNSGNLALFWSPNFYITNNDASSFSNMINDYNVAHNIENSVNQFNAVTCSSIYYNNDNSLTGLSDNNHFNGELQEFHTIATSKYRLVSALLRIKYAGKLINQSGVAYACATYNDTQRAIWGGVSQDSIVGQHNWSDWFVNPSISKYGDFNLINKGQWSTVFTADRLKKGIELLYLPTDPLNAIFSNSGSIGNKSTFKYNNITDIKTTNNNNVAAAYFQPENANIQYAIGLSGLTQNEPFLIEEYRIFETIPTEENMPYFRQSQSLPIDDVNIPMSVTKIFTLPENNLRVSTENKSDKEVKRSIKQQIGDTIKKVVKSDLVKDIGKSIIQNLIKNM